MKSGESVEVNLLQVKVKKEWRWGSWHRTELDKDENFVSVRSTEVRHDDTTTVPARATTLQVQAYVQQLIRKP